MSVLQPLDDKIMKMRGNAAPDNVGRMCEKDKKEKEKEKEDMQYNRNR